jgi:hypothetical protein
MQGMSESVAGRAAIVQLVPFSLSETMKVNLLHAGCPEVLARPKVWVDFLLPRPNAKLWLVEAKSLSGGPWHPP